MQCYLWGCFQKGSTSISDNSSFMIKNSYIILHVNIAHGVMTQHSASHKKQYMGRDISFVYCTVAARSDSGVFPT